MLNLINKILRTIHKCTMFAFFFKFKVSEKHLFLLLYETPLQAFAKFVSLLKIPICKFEFPLPLVQLPPANHHIQ